MTPKGQPIAFLRSLLRSKEDECIEWPFAKSTSGYARVEVGCRPNRRTTLASRVICEWVHGIAPDKEAAHSCGNGSKGCVNPNHIRWRSHAENQKEMAAHGQSTRGEKSYHAKITAGDVHSIRKLSGTRTGASVAKLFGISQAQVTRIVKRQRWGHLE